MSLSIAYLKETLRTRIKVAQVCNSPGYAQSSFTITGRGGLPTNPIKDVSTPDAVEVGWVSLNPSGERSSEPVTIKPTTAPERIVEASGWAVNQKGEVVLTANASAGGRGSWQKDAHCSASQVYK